MNYFSRPITALGLVLAAYTFSPQQADAQQKYHTVTIYKSNDGTLNVGIDGKYRNITHDWNSFWRRVEQEKLKFRNRPKPTPWVTVKIRR